MITIAVDFDGTIVTHEYPRIGKPVPYALEVMETLINKYNVRLILWTMRSGDYLKQAVDYVESNGIKLFDANKNVEQLAWTDSPKCYANAYIDDAAVGCPLIYPENGERPYVDWLAVYRALTKKEFNNEQN